jgi:hypothetical protein
VAGIKKRDARDRGIDEIERMQEKRGEVAHETRKGRDAKGKRGKRVKRGKKSRRNMRKKRSKRGDKINAVIPPINTMIMKTVSTNPNKGLYRRGLYRRGLYRPGRQGRQRGNKDSRKEKSKKGGKCVPAISPWPSEK